ncbi:MAG: hypothetical protein H0S79_26255 [Anaerolineaceae bacterium]|nr:hypothetical protein [Anaerolineaceae bacterium]
MKKILRTILFILLIIASVSACQSKGTTCFYNDEQIDKINLTINVEGSHSSFIERSIIRMIKNHYKLCGLRFSTKNQADILIDISIKTDAWGHTYGQRPYSDTGYTETSTRIEINIFDKSQDLIWEERHSYTSEPYEEIVEGQFSSKGNAPYQESFIPVLLQINYELFGDQYIILLQQAYQDDETDFGTFLYDLINVEIPEPLTPGLFELK